MGFNSETTEKPVGFGDIITTDRMIAPREESEGILGEKTALIIYEMTPHFTACYPLKTKTGDDAYRSFQPFRGPNDYYVYSDYSGEIWKSMGSRSERRHQGFTRPTRT